MFSAVRIESPVVLKVSVKKEETQLDLDKLYHAVSIAESGGCSTAWHQAAKNCVSIMTWSGGKRHLKSFQSYEANKQAFKDLWSKHYKKFPDIALATRYTGADHASDWLRIVKANY